MSVEYNLKIKIIKRGKNKIYAQDIIEALVNEGWSLFSEGNTIIYTDVLDGDDFNFVSKNIKKEDYYEIVSKKQKYGEPIACAMFYTEDRYIYRIDVIITSDFEVIISPDDLTKKMMNCENELLDMNWYICKIIPKLSNKNMIVESFSFCKI